MTVNQTVTSDAGTTTPRAAASPSLRRPGAIGKAVRLLVLTVGALVFLFPFYYMVLGSLQSQPDTSLSGAIPDLANLSWDNFREINERLHLGRSLVNSGIFTSGVLIGTVVVGSLAGYALAQLQFRGRKALFAVMLLVQMLPFHLLMIPLYVMIVRDFGLGDSYLGMILPGAVNATSVFIFRQFFLSLPADIFESARMDGATELQVLRHIALPLIRPALLTVVLVTFIGPWNDFLWPFLVTKETEMQPLAVGLASFISAGSGAASNPFGAILAGAVTLAAPVLVLFVIFQRYFTSTNLGSGTKG
jgi:multiple sugar transport system permease protein